MRDNLSEVMNVVLKSMLNSSPPVCLTAIRTIKGMSLELYPHEQDKHCHMLIALLFWAPADKHFLLQY